MTTTLSLADDSRTISLTDKASSSWCNAYNTGYLPMAGEDRFRFSTSAEYVDKDKRVAPKAKNNRHKRRSG